MNLKNGKPSLIELRPTLHDDLSTIQMCARSGYNKNWQLISPSIY
ncbi:MAG: hypothetical protein WA888_03440 [Burkholderiaceae bacterium]